MENYAFYIPSTQIHPEVTEQKPLAKIANEHLAGGIIARGVDLVARDQGVDHQQALAMIVRDWMEFRGIPVVGENPLDEAFESGQETLTMNKLQGAWQWLISEG